MNNLKELLRDADPLRHEPSPPPGQRALQRQAVLAASARAHAPASGRRRSRRAFFATSTLMLAAVLALGAILWSVFNSNLQAAIRFEVRMAETTPAPGLQKAKVSDSNRYIYLHPEVIVSNSDIASVHVVEVGGPSQYGISVKLTAAGADKMRRATAAHIGKPLAILLDGKVIMAPVVRDSIGESAMITGHYTKRKAQSIAERIVKGIGMR